MSRGGLVTLWFACGLLAACYTLTPKVTAVKNDLERELPGADFEREMGLKLGRISLGLAKGMVNLFHVDGDEVDVLRSLSRVEIGIYRTETLLDTSEISLPQHLERSLARKGWVRVVRHREADAATWVYYQLRGDSLSGVFVVYLDADELGLIRLKGRLDRALTVAIGTARRWSRGEEPLS